MLINKNSSPRIYAASCIDLSRGDLRLTFPSQATGPGMLWLVLPQPMKFTGDAFGDLAST